MTETIQEFVDSRGVRMRVDAEGGVIRGVKILGLQSRNGRTYRPEALAEAARLYEEAKVNVNHPQGNPGGPRDYRDRIGVIRNVTARPDEGLFADLHFNPKHALAEQLAWDAEHAPENVGFSHNVQARTSRRGGQLVVEAITKVQSVDLVADPATTRGLFESAPDASDADDAPSGEEAPEQLGGVTADQLRRHRPDLVEEILAESRAELAGLREQLDRLEAAEAMGAKRLAARRLLAQYQLPDPDTAEGWARSIVSDAFMESLLAAPDEPSMRKLVEERARLVREAAAESIGSRRPLAREQCRVYASPARDTKTFVESIT
jgi:hypothetical protein